jgi:hypothetical protein
MKAQTTTYEAARASVRRARALSLEYLAGGIYLAPRRHLFQVDLPMLMASVLDGTGGVDTPARRREVGRQAIAVLREMGCPWPIVVRYHGIAGRQ